MKRPFLCYLARGRSARHLVGPCWSCFTELWITIALHILHML